MEKNKKLTPAKIPSRSKIPLILSSSFILSLFVFLGWKKGIIPNQIGKTPEVFTGSSAQITNLTVSKIEIDDNVPRRVNFWIKNDGETTIPAGSRYQYQACGVKWNRENGQMQTSCKNHTRSIPAPGLEPGQTEKRWFQAVGLCPPETGTFPVKICVNDNCQTAQLNNADVKVQCRTNKDCSSGEFCFNCGCQRHTKCEDPDGGKNIKQKATVHFLRSGTKYSRDYRDNSADYCHPTKENVLVEKFCYTSSYQKSGRTVVPSCTTVSGQRSGIYGSMSGDFNGEFCSFLYEEIPCPEGYQCKNGACVEKSPSQTPTATTMPTPVSTFVPTSTPVSTSAPLSEGQINTDITGDGITDTQDLIQVLKNMGQ